MNDSVKPIAALGGLAPTAQAVAGEVRSPTPPPGLNFNSRELEVFEYICTALREAGIEHLTAGMPIAMIVHTYCQWLDREAECETKGRTQTSANGWVSPTPWAEDARRLKQELGQWLPKACLTIPSLTRVRKESGAQAGQDDLFGDLVNHGTSSPRSGWPN
ncbi:P27 family phage terminase small subunit [Eleftheria terrae]|uniref:P27 family phage terminase small subunit n=1 Tax=Eleftheria terrae TaxID=1597781 RepID=UPI00263ABFC3|nr:P27 family phage terminase small subunit [Eleftheria terrae]WKB52301.1 P27 family phage terminase small subunit [Eleftheria terrae]